MKSLSSGVIAAIIITLALVIWMLLGAATNDNQYKNPRNLEQDSGLPSVQIKQIKHQVMHPKIRLSGRTSANREVHIKAEISAKVIEIPVNKGTKVKKGNIILKLDPRDWPARVEQAQANLKQRQLEMKSVQNLKKKNLANQAQLARAKTVLANAKADYIQAQRQLDASIIRAPFDGVIDQRQVEIGDFVTPGMHLISVIDFDPFLIKANIPENEAARIKQGDKVKARLVDGTPLTGKITFKSASANPQTRSYAIEIEVDASKHTLSSGMTAEVTVPQPATRALFVSPALLIIDPQGVLGLKAVDENNTVIFLAVNILEAEQDGIWIYGPKSDAKIITVGQGFVDIGDKVMVEYEGSNEQTSHSKKPTNTLSNTAN